MVFFVRLYNLGKVSYKHKKIGLQALFGKKSAFAKFKALVSYNQLTAKRKEEHLGSAGNLPRCSVRQLANAGCIGQANELRRIYPSPHMNKRARRSRDQLSPKKTT